MKKSKIKQPDSREIYRSQINFANYNPRKISSDSKKKLKANLKRVGILGGIVWNEATGNLVSGHQRISVIDEVNKYNSKTKENDYLIRVEVVQMDDKTEKEQNIFMNNRSVQGEFDYDLLRDMISDIDYSFAGIENFDLEMMGIGELDFEFGNNESWCKDELLDDLTKEATEEENRNIDRSKSFYEDSKENQIARHNEVEKIKERIRNSNDTDKDGGALSYVVLSFSNPFEKEGFMVKCGYDPSDKYIDGEEFTSRIDLLD